MATFQQLKDRVNDTVNGQKNVTDWQASMGLLVNDAYLHVVSQLLCYQKTTAALALTANDGDYSIVTDLAVSDFSRLRVVKYTAANGSNTLNTIAPTTPDEIIALRAANPSATSPATAYAVQGWDGLMLHPLPATGDTVTLIYGAVPALMVATSDTPTRLPQEWHHLISTRAAATAMEFYDIDRANRQQQQYEHELALAHKWFNQSKGSRGFAPASANDNIRVVWPGDFFSGIYN